MLRERRLEIISQLKFDVPSEFIDKQVNVGLGPQVFNRAHPFFGLLAGINDKHEIPVLRLYLLHFSVLSTRHKKNDLPFL